MSWLHLSLGTQMQSYRSCPPLRPLVQAEREQRAHSQEREADLIKTMQHKLAVSERAKRMQQDQYFDNQELLRVQRQQKEAHEAEQRELAREREAQTAKTMEKKVRCSSSLAVGGARFHELVWRISFTVRLLATSGVRRGKGQALASRQVH